MNINYKELSGKENTSFVVNFFDTFCKVPFGSLSKRDIECLILKLLIEHKMVNTGSNRLMADALGINETRLKGYLVDAWYKFGTDQKDENVESIIKDVFINKSTKILHDNGQYLFVVEDPIKKLDFEQKMKDIGFYSDTSFNREIVKVKDTALLAFLFELDKDKKHEKFKTLITQNKSIEKEALDIYNSTKSIQEKCEKYLKIALKIVGAAGDAIPAVALLKNIAGTIIG
ncbi:hypothetical protein AGMMS49579_16330 [Spirochaetia bacterium]|nr:hypothetical protein AGMMS49579_16330 [Spirochaetia bacterium]